MLAPRGSHAMRTHDPRPQTAMIDVGVYTAMAFIAGMSPVAWRHVNLFGAMDFGAATAPVDIDALASHYADPEYWTRMQRAAAEEKDEEG